MISKDALVRALRRAENCWKKVFGEDNRGMAFDVHRIAPSPEAIAILAIGILNGGDGGDEE